MGSHNYRDAADFAHDYIGRTKAVECSWIKPIARAYRDNIDRITSLWMALPFFTCNSAEAIELWARACFNISGKVGFDPQTLTKEELNLIVQEVGRIENGLAEERNREIEKYKRNTIKRGVELVDMIATQPHYVIDSAIQTLFSSMLLHAWTTFETICHDLYEASLNYGPKAWVIAAWKRGDEDKSVSWEHLVRYQFDIRERMGSIALRKKPIGGYNDTRERYKVIFADAEDIFNKYPDIRALEAIRNAMAHRGNWADEKFVQTFKGFPDLGVFAEGDLLFFDGKIIGHLCNMVFNCLSDLILHIDSKASIVA